jgi:Polysaccharide biosynthesis protein
MEKNRSFQIKDPFQKQLISKNRVDSPILAEATRHGPALRNRFSTLFPERKPLYLDNFGSFAALGRCVMTTGAGGSIGSALPQRICGASRLQLILMDHSEQAVSALQLRPGDKLRQDLLSREESLGAEACAAASSDLRAKVDAESLEAQFQVIAKVTRCRDLAALLEVLPEMVPRYLPGTRLRKKTRSRCGRSPR